MDGRDFPQHLARLQALAVPLVIDHIGKFLGPVTPLDPAFLALRRLLDGGRCWVKLSAPYESSRSGAPAYADVALLAQTLAQDYPERCLWASNWPHPNRVPAPTNPELRECLSNWVPGAATLARILVSNPKALYGFED
jgi:D-galactarolactone isomerase